MTDRRRSMASSVATTATARGLAPEGVDLLGRALEVAMAPRVAQLDEEAPAYLHPGRTALVLLLDVGPLPPQLLSAAAVHESEELALRVGLDTIRDELGDRVSEIAGSFPLPGDEALAERLVTLAEGPRLAALAERLDQLRHLHLRPDLSDRWPGIHDEVGAVWLPVAERTHARLTDRYRHWHRSFVGRRTGG